VPPPFRIGVMQLTMEPLDEMIESVPWRSFSFVVGASGGRHPDC